MIDDGPTVIVARRVHAGHEADFERWNTRLVETAAQFPGYVGSDNQPPNEAHPEEWVNIYRFDGQENLDRWLNSSKRAAIMSEGASYVNGATREQRIARLDPVADVVTAITSDSIRPELADRYRKAHADFAHAMTGFPGFLHCRVFDPVPGVQDDYVTVFTFDNRSHLDDWLDSVPRRALVEAVEPLLAAQATLNFVDGFAGWFAPMASSAPARWKTAMVVVLALYPTTLTLSLVQRILFPNVAWVPALFVSNVVSVAILTWAVIPFVTSLLNGWLHR